MKKELLSQKLRKGEVIIIPTDTIYGIVGSALNPETVEKIYQLKSRNSKKPLIILISSLHDLLLFKIILTQKDKDFLGKIWPGKVSVILPCLKKDFSYLHRGKKSLAFRLPKDKKIMDILKITGPLVAPSANLEGLPPAKTIKEAKNYFGKKIQIYLDGGKLESLPSTLVENKKGKWKVLREGEVKIKQDIIE
jgi:L-threonylcarbamoyladenylate synthase